MARLIAATSGDSLSHPLVLLILGGIFTGYFLPRLTRNWQDRQKELEIKVNLVNQISAVVVPVWGLLVSGVEALDAKDTETRDELMRAYRHWEIESTKILSTLSAYFRDGYVPQKWLVCSEMVRVAFNLTWNDSVPVREALVETLRMDVSWISNEEPTQRRLGLGAMNTLEEQDDLLCRRTGQRLLARFTRAEPQRTYFGGAWAGVDDAYWSGVVTRRSWFHFRQSILTTKNGMIQLILDEPILRI